MPFDSFSGYSTDRQKPYFFKRTVSPLLWSLSKLQMAKIGAVEEKFEHFSAKISKILKNLGFQIIRGWFNGTKYQVTDFGF